MFCIEFFNYIDMKKISFYFILVLWVAYGIYLRWYELGTGSFWIDEWYSSLIAYFITQNNFLPKLAGGMYEFSQYFFHLFQALFFHFFWFSDVSARLPSFFISIVFIFLYYIFSLHLSKESRYKNVVVLFFMFLFLFSTWQIIWSREARFYEMLGFLYFIVTFFLYRYIQSKRQMYLSLFSIFLFFWLLFHHFFLAFIPIVLVLFFYDLFSRKDRKSLFFLWTVLLWYGGIQLFLKIFSGGEVSIWSIIPKINSIEQYHFFTFFSYYLQVFIEQLWVIFYAYLLGIMYLLFSKKWQEFLLFGWIFLINIISISFWYFAHSRYMFHLFSLITLFWCYSIVMVWEYCMEKYKNIYGKIGIFVLMTAIFISIMQTFHFTLLPQRFYYIDATSPKPNFKNTYEYVKNTYPDTKIISWFPHMCFWYNSENFEKCVYALPMNLIWNTIFNEGIIKKGKENYTSIPYIEHFGQTDRKNYVFIFDDLTLKNTIAKDLVSQIISECPMIYKDVWNQQVENFIWVWKCE